MKRGGDVGDSEMTLGAGEHTAMIVELRGRGVDTMPPGAAMQPEPLASLKRRHSELSRVGAAAEVGVRGEQQNHDWERKHKCQ